jgi:FkbM family methyltransferase
MWVMLPSGTDIFLTGGKSHGSEIRLARFLIQRLRPGDHLLDVGGHFGYFTLLAAELVGKTGQVRVFEPSAPTYALLRDNIAGLEQVVAEPKAVSSSEEPLVFYEFPPLFSEYNSTDIAQFEQEEWFQQNPPLKKEVPAVSMDHLTGSGDFRPQWIKIDAEGGELSVIRGGERYLRAQAPTLVMEYLEPSRNNAPHRAAAELLSEWGYRSYAIGATGELLSVGDLDAHLLREGLDSDNIVFAKPVG